MARRIGWIVLMLLLLSGAAAAADEEPRAAAVLQRGINLPFWFWYAPDDVQGRFSDADFELIRQLGFTFVRVPIDLNYVMDSSSPDLLKADGVAQVEKGVQRLLDHGLAVLIDLHSTSLEDSDSTNYSGALEDPEFVEVFIRFWQSFAARWSAYDPASLIIGPMNEPVFEDDPAAWLPIQERLVAAIREVAPEHTIVATAALWSAIDTLVEMTPLPDPNIVYDFHFYDPFVFTHQGAEWSWEGVQPLRSVPYPSSPAAVQPLLDMLPQDATVARDALAWYGEERWDSALIRSRIQQSADWAAAYGVPVICTEFGAYNRYAPPADRIRWIEDTRTALEAHGIGWAMWEYDDSFGLVDRTLIRNGPPVVNEAVALALGLNP